MEVLLKRPSAVKEEMKVDFNGDDGGGVMKKHIGDESIPDTSALMSSTNSSMKGVTNTENEEELLESARVEMGEVKRENERLKTILTRIMKDYDSLQAQIVTIAQQQHQHQRDNQTKAPAADLNTGLDQEEHEAELLSLSLGTIKNTNTDGKDGESKSVGDMGSGGLSLALQCSSKMEGSTSGDQSSDGVEKDEEEGGGEQWPPSKVLGKNPRNDEQDLSSLVHVKKARVSVRARCDAPTMNDGCQWRKYGQKISKGNPCPRAYYRCTVAPGCPVRKQVQRCAEDMSILITTYEGTHNHPLPLAATTVASTTSAAASMLLSPSSSSSAPPFATASLGFGLSAQSSKPPPPPNFHHLSATPSQPPTITLDLTSPSPQFNNANSSLGFSSYPSLSSGYFSKYTNQFHNNINNYNNYTNRINPGFPSYLPKNSGSQQEALTDTLAKAITLDPSFKSVLAAAITSIVGGEGGGQTQAIPTGTATGSTSYHLNKPSPMLPLGKFGYPDQSSSLGFLNNSKSSPSMENRNPLN